MHQHGSANSVIDWETLGPLLERGAELNTPAYEQAIMWLRELRPARSTFRVLDIGSGPGVTTCLLAQSFPDAHVVAVDGTPALLDRARSRAAGRGLAGQIGTHTTELPEGLDSLEGADLVWASQVVHHLGDQRAAVRRLRRLVRPGGLLALAEGGLTSRFLPRDIGIGRPGIQARLDAAAEEWFTAMRAALPGTRDTVEDWPGLLADAGLAPSGSRTFLLDLPAPLDPAVREHVIADVVRLRELIHDLIDPGDLATVDRLLDPDDPAGLARRPDVFLLGAKTVHTAVAPPGSAAG
jgi:SAM-dependent methyltransferase